MSVITSRELVLADGQNLAELFGVHDAHLKEIETAFRVRVTTTGSLLRIEGDEEGVRHASRVITNLLELLRSGYRLQPRDVKFLMRLAAEESDADIQKIFSERIVLPSKRGFVTPKSETQRHYIEMMRTYDVVIAIGPAGTGKTYLAVAMAVTGLLTKQFTRIILARPAVEAGERLGFLPGDLAEKVSPYLRPLYDALYDMMEYDKIQTMLERGIIEMAPLAYMRGRTLNDAFIILDEAQNTSSEQMQMFLTRLGFGSKAVITGDITQVDLPPEKPSGLIEVQKIVRDIAGIKFVYFSDRDVVRHELVQQIILAYARHRE
ncbi:MAG: PhoH family protein [Candidatus Tectomicrobia bacterium]|nr:PhoH family protein [Candidatus Tectomicrobia bacterium]